MNQPERLQARWLSLLPHNPMGLRTAETSREARELAYEHREPVRYWRRDQWRVVWPQWRDE